VERGANLYASFFRYFPFRLQPIPPGETLGNVAALLSCPMDTKPVPECVLAMTILVSVCRTGVRLHDSVFITVEAHRTLVCADSPVMVATRYCVPVPY